MVIEHKEKLKNDKAALELLLSENGDQCIDYKAQFNVINQKLEDMGKPEVTPMFLDKVYETILEGVGEFDFSDEDNYNTEFELDYDNKVTLSTLELCNHQDLVEMIVEKISLLFVEAEELDTTEDDNHSVQ